MSFGDKRLDNAYDNWATQTPEEYFGDIERKIKEEKRIEDVCFGSYRKGSFKGKREGD